MDAYRTNGSYLFSLCALWGMIRACVGNILPCLAFYKVEGLSLDDLKRGLEHVYSGYNSAGSDQ